MATATIGRNSNDMNWWVRDQSKHQAWDSGAYYQSGLGRMVSAFCHGAGYAGTSGGVVAWKNDVPSFYHTTDGIGGVGGGAPGYNGTDLSASADVPALGSEWWRFGFYAAGGCAGVVRANSGGTTYFKGSAITNSTGAESSEDDYQDGGGVHHPGQMRIFGTYFVVEFYEKTGGAMAKIFTRWKTGGAFGGPVQVFVRVGGGWTQVDRLVERGELEWRREFPVVLLERSGWRRAVARWDYDRPRYIGTSFPGDPAWEPQPVRPYILRAA